MPQCPQFLDVTHSQQLSYTKISVYYMCANKSGTHHVLMSKQRVEVACALVDDTTYH